MNYNSAFQC